MVGMSQDTGVSKKRAREEGLEAKTPAEKHSLEGTRYGSLQKQVEKMVRMRKTQGQQDTAKRQPKRDRPALDKKPKQLKAVEEPDSQQEKRVRIDDSVPKSKVPVAANVEVSAAAQEFTNDHTVYVQGLPFTSTEDDVRQFFAGTGTIASLRLPKWHDSSKLRGYGHVVFADSESAEKALELNGLYLQDRYIKVERPLVPRALANNTPTVKPPGCKTIFIKNLPYEVTEEEVRKEFMVYGPIVKVRLAVWQHTNNQKGFGYVDFKREESTEIAVKKSGSIKIQGRVITADYETGAPKAGFKDRDDKKKKSK